MQKDAKITEVHLIFGAKIAWFGLLFDLTVIDIEFLTWNEFKYMSIMLKVR